ncbi:MAG: ribonuclease P protein component [Candidatus Harrisonbacteria bacterium]|nr:ribonuclease P protein component [Candidatus Harrisonbacteria bacterium]
MLAKQYRLPVQTVLNKKAKSVHKGRYFFIKIFEGAKEQNRFAVVVSKKVDTRAVRRNQIKRSVFRFFQSNPPTQRLGDVLVIIQKGARDASDHAMMEELKKIFRTL